MRWAAAGQFGEMERRFSRRVLRSAVFGLSVAVVLVVAGYFWGPRIGRSPAAQELATRATMRTIGTALGAYKANRGGYPPSLQTLVQEKMIENRLTDAWRHGLIYTNPGARGQPYSLMSMGNDGVLGTDDDIDAWRLDEQN